MTEAERIDDLGNRLQTGEVASAADLFPLDQMTRQFCGQLRCGNGSRSLAEPARQDGVCRKSGEAPGDLAELLDQTPFNVAIADLYKTRFNGVPGVVYAAGSPAALSAALSSVDLDACGRGMDRLRVDRSNEAVARLHLAQLWRVPAEP